MKILGVIAAAYKQISTAAFWFGGQGYQDGYNFAWAWLKGNTFGAKYADPTQFPYLWSGAVSNQVNAVVLGTSNAQEPLTGFRFSSSGWGSQYSAPTDSYFGEIRNVLFQPSGATIAVSFVNYQSNPKSSYAFNASTGFGTKSVTVFDNDNQLNGIMSMAFKPDGTAIAFSKYSSPKYAVYSYDTNWGTLYSPPGVEISQEMATASWSPNGKAVAFGRDAFNTQSGSPLIFAWTASGYGTSYSFSQGTGPLIWLSNNLVAYSQNQGVYYARFTEGVGFGSVLAGSNFLNSSRVYRLDSNPEGTVVTASGSSNNKGQAYNVTTNGGGTHIAMPAFFSDSPYNHLQIR